MNITTTRPRIQSVQEEIANSVSHGLGLVGALLVSPMLVFASHTQSSRGSFVGVSVFATTMVLLYLTSMLYHALPDGRARELLLKLDHGAIYLFIAGSYTPFALRVIPDASGWLLFSLVWLIAGGGLLLKVFDRLRHPALSTGLYVLMGWVVLMAAYPLAVSMTTSSIDWLVAGGVVYTVGVVFFALDARVRFSHCVWHVFVMAGTACHLMAVLSCDV